MCIQSRDGSHHSLNEPRECVGASVDRSLETGPIFRSFDSRAPILTGPFQASSRFRKVIKPSQLDGGSSVRLPGSCQTRLRRCGVLLRRVLLRCLPITKMAQSLSMGVQKVTKSSLMPTFQSDSPIDTCTRGWQLSRFCSSKSRDQQRLFKCSKSSIIGQSHAGQHRRRERRAWCGDR
jgi:hypothetical protein